LGNKKSSIVLRAQTWEYSDSFMVLENVWDATYGELSFKYSIGGFSYEFSHIGFTMTHVENVC